MSKVTNKQSHYERMTTAKEGPLIIKMAIPSIVTMLVTNVYNMADTAFVGKLGTSASGAVGIVFGFMGILQAIGFLFGQGSGSILSRALGSKNQEGANRAASTGLFFSGFFSLVAMILCFIFLDPLVHFLGSTDTIAPYAKTYISYILVAAPFIVTSFTMNNILRFEGRALLGTIGLMTGGILNILGDAILMFGFHMGIAGAGLSTCISQIISFCILVSMFVRKKSQIQLSPRYIHLKLNFFGDIVGTGLPSLIRQGLNSLAVIVLNMEAAPYGDAAIAAMSIVSRIIFFVFSISLGVGQGYQPVCGFNYGAKKYDRVRNSFRFSFVVGEIAMILLSGVAFFFSGNLIGIFRDDPLVIEIGTRALRLQLLSQLVTPICVVTEMTLQSTGKKLQASILSSLKSGVLFIPLLLFLASVRGLAGIQEAQPLTNVLVLLPSLYCMFRFFQSLTDAEAGKKK